MSRPAKRFFQTLIGTVIGGAFGIVLIALLPRLFDEEIAPAAIPLLVVFGWYAGILVHECGHLLAGKAAGGKFLFMSVGPVKLISTGRGLRLGRQRKLIMGGLTAVAPPLDRPVGRYMVTLVAGGPLASLLSAVVTYFLTFQTAEHLRSALATYSLASSFCLLLSLIPFSSGNYRTDGERLLIAARGGSRAELLNALATSNSLFAAGYRMREMPEPLVECWKRGLDDSREGVTARVLLHSWALDRRNIEEADKWLAEALTLEEQWPKPMRASLYLEAAFMSARHHNNALEARSWLQRAGKAHVADRASRMVTEAAVLFAEGKKEEASQFLDQAERWVPQCVLDGARKTLLETIADLRQVVVQANLTSGAVAT